MGKKTDAPDPTRDLDRQRLDEGDFDFKVGDFFAILNTKGECKYFTDDKGDGEDRLKEMATGREGIGEEGAAQPPIFLVPVLAIETERFDKDGAESRTRGKRTGKVEV